MSHNLAKCCSLLLFLLCGCFNPAALSEKTESPPAAEEAAAEQPAPQVDQPPPAQPQANAQPEVGNWIINKVRWRIVDMRKAMEENPNYVVVDRVQATGGDYLSAVSQAYVSARTRIHVLQLKHELDLQKALNDDKWPKFEQFETALRQSQIELNDMFPYQVYAYDDQTGEIVILEDPVEKRRLREAAGLPPE